MIQALGFLAQTNSPFFSRPSGSGELFLWIGITTLVGIAALMLILQAPPQARKWIVGAVTFVAGLFYFLLWIWPVPQDRGPNDIARNMSEEVAFFLSDGTNVVGNLSNILTAFLLLLGVFSLVRIHVIKVYKQQKDWAFSIVLLAALFGIAGVGYWSWLVEMGMTPEQLQQASTTKPDQWLGSGEGWAPSFIARDFLFEGLLQAMDAAMFSIIAFYILSAAYRAFRIRSVEATILLASALIVMVSLLGMAELYWNMPIDKMTGGDPSHFANNFRIGEIAGFIRQSFQVPGLRAIDFGIGIGALAMGLRLWLGLDRSGGSN